MTGPDFRTIFAGVRPARLAVLFDEADPEWQDTCRRILECLGTAWGGKHSIIIPTDGSTIAPIFWDLLDAFDPDYICEYQKTALDWKIGSPHKYEELLDQHLRDHHPGAAPSTEQRERLDDAVSQMLFPTRGISPELQEQLRKRLSPFFFEGNVIEQTFQARTEATYPLTPLSVVLPHCRHTDSLVVVNSRIDGMPPLWIESILGATFPEQTARFAAFGVHVEPVALSAAQLFELMTLQVDRGRQPLPSYAAFGPLEMSMAVVSEYRSVQERTSELPAVIVAGSTAQDFALYFGLSRIRPRIVWLWPAWLDVLASAEESATSHSGSERRFEDPAVLLANALGNALMRRAIKSIEFTSVSLEGAELANLFERFAKVSPRAENAISAQARICAGFDSLLKYPGVAFNTDNFSIPTTHEVLAGKAVGFFPTPKPKGFATIVPYDHRWITELRVDGLSYPGIQR